MQRQYTGTVGRIENVQVAVYLTYAVPRGHVLIDRALYLSRSWSEDPDRCAAAGIPADIAFATKPALATAMITCARQEGVPAAWVAGDEVYGADPSCAVPLAVWGSATCWGSRRTAGCPPTPGHARERDRRAAARFGVAVLPGRARQQRPRYYSWAGIALPPKTTTIPTAVGITC